ncbi:8973_t:CDS:2, partial [Funneliformis geosporum]
MILDNFNSYIGKQEIGPFHKLFSAIVETNGSGKSNAIDALLFVFGYRANIMRKARLSELIHLPQGCEKLDTCMVEIHFEEIIDVSGSDDYEIVPKSHLVISRQVFRNITNKYFINGRQSKYTEVTSLLKEKGIDLDHNRFLILQGEVESISQMKPKAPNKHEYEFLKYLKDIIGTSEKAYLKVKKKQSLEDRLGNLGTINSKFSSDITPETIMAKLERGRSYLEVHWREFNENFRPLESQQKKDELSKLEFELTKLKMDANNYAKHIKCNEKIMAELRKQNDSKIDDYTMRLENFRIQIDHLTQELDRLQRQHSKIEEEINILEGKIKFRAHKSHIDHIKYQIDLINDRITKSQVAKSRAEMEMNKFANSLENSERELEELNNEIEILTKNIQQNANIRIKA